MKKTLILLLFLFGCGSSTKPPVSGGTHYSTPAVITVNPGNGKATACYGVVTIEQVTPGTYNIYWTDARHKDCVIEGVHDVAVTNPLPPKTVCISDIPPGMVNCTTPPPACDK